MLQHNIKASIDKNLPFSSLKEAFVQLIAVSSKGKRSKYYSIVYLHYLMCICVVSRGQIQFVSREERVITNRSPTILEKVGLLLCNSVDQFVYFSAHEDVEIHE